MKNKIKILGASGGKSKTDDLISIQISSKIIIDAGNIINAVKNPLEIEHIFITHAHLDHILDIGFLIGATFEIRTIPLKIYGQKETLQSIKKHIFW